MAFVLDASVTATWFLSDETSETADAALDQLIDGAASVPSLWWFEVRNLLVMNERRGRHTGVGLETFLDYLTDLAIHLDYSPSSPEVLRLARQHRLTVYDASYLELAQRLELPLASLDTDLIRAARAEQVQIVSLTA